MSRYLASPSVQLTAYQNAINSGHGADWRDLGPDGEPLTWWRQTLRRDDRLVARRLRALLTWRLDPRPAPEPPRGADSDLDDVLLAAVNALDVARSADLALTLRGPGLGLVLAGLRERGERVLATRPDLAAVLPGPPVAVVLDGDTPSSTPSEVEQLAPGTAPDSREQIDALVAAALRGEDLSRLPHHLLAAIRAALLERALDLAVEAKLPAAADPDADPETLLADLLASPEFQAAAAGLRAALGGVSLALTPTGGYGNG
ncbi:hypothetical protein [Azospirillum isscasi]|uniref:Uncharacterized protein n=1 Tax=Azospirillum isscasi TaxID=3053926 RepID=A0ABU0WQN7_9PROT|nr:hypothetical protein [Azospirillum isscasi]MDQ2106558.1 hypothetical protein [Azospirillum isscasi]